MKRHYKILFFGLIILAGVALHFAGLTEYINIESFKANRQQLLTFVHNHYALSAMLYALLYILATTFSLPIAAPLTLIGGFLFGVFGATLLTNIGATAGATLTFLMFRYFLGNTVQKKYHSQLATFNTNITHYGANYLLLARLIVFIPFFLVNILAGLTTIPLSTFIWTTSLGIIPGSLLYTYAGKQIGSINALSDVFSAPVVIAFALLIALGLISIVVKNYLITHKMIK